jgi:hypothetical protein
VIGQLRSGETWREGLATSGYAAGYTFTLGRAYREQANRPGFGASAAAWGVAGVAGGAAGALAAAPVVASNQLYIALAAGGGGAAASLESSVVTEVEATAESCPVAPAVPLGRNAGGAFQSMFDYLIRPVAAGGAGLRNSEVLRIGTNPAEMDIAGSIHFNLAGTSPEFLADTQFFTAGEFQHILANPGLPVTFYNVPQSVVPLLPAGANVSPIVIR